MRRLCQNLIVLTWRFRENIDLFFDIIRLYFLLLVD